MPFLLRFPSQDPIFPTVRPPLTAAVLVSKDNNNNYHLEDLLRK